MPITHIPCAPTTNNGERLVRHFLMTKLADSYGILLTNYHHPAGSNEIHEHDLVLINQWGIWALEVKHWRGRIDADQVWWQREDGHRYHSPLTSVEIKARALAATLHNAGFSNVSVVGVVVLSHPEARLKISDPGRQGRVFRPNEELIKAVSGQKYLYRLSNRSLTSGEIKQIADMLVQLKVDPERKVIGNYRLLRDLGEGMGFHAFEAEHIVFADRHARVKKYQISRVVSTAELLEAERRFTRDMLALTRIDHHPNIVRAYDFLRGPDSDDTYWLILEWIKGITLQDRLGYEMPISFEEQRRILYELAAALEYCHANGVLHRNLNPASIYLAEDGTVKLSDFDFARVHGNHKTISKTGAPLILNKYTAPELRTDARSADARADLYALGAIWYEMAIRPKAGEPILISQLGGAALSGSAVELLRRLLEPLPNDRPRRALEVKERLKGL